MSGTETRVVRYIITGDNSGAVKAMKGTEVAAAKAGSALEVTGSKLKSAGASMSAFGHKLNALSLPLLAIGGYSIKAAMDFQTSMTQVQTQAGATGKEVGYFSRELLKMGHTGFDATELSKGLFRVSSDGFKGAEALRVLKAAAAGAQVSGADLEQTTNALGGALRTHLKDVHSAAGAMSILNSIVGLGKFRFEELNEALTSGFLVEAKRVGIGLGEIGNALDALARKGVQPQEEATRLQKTLIQFSAITGVAKTALHSVGIGQYQLAEDMKKHGLIYALQDLKKHLGDVSSYKENAILAQAFGRSKGAGNVGALLESLPEMEKIAKQREKYGSLLHALGIRESNASFKMAEGLANLKNALVHLGQVLIPTVIPALVKLSKVLITGVEWFKRAPKPIKDAVLAFTALLAVGGPLLIFFGTLISTGGEVVLLLGKLKTFAAVGADAGEGATGLQVFSKGLLAIGGTAGELFLVLAAMEGINRLVLKSKQSIFTKAFNYGKGLGYEAAHTAGQVKIPYASLLFGDGGGGSNGAPKGSLQSELEAMGYRVKGNGFTAPRFVQTLVEAELAKGQHPGQPIVVHSHVHLDGKEVAHNTATHIRNDPGVAKPVAEGVTKHAQFKAVGGG